ncbi:MAG: hypothetical protein PVG99_07935, partial [Desulfobacteraceae bacterium]
KNEGNAARAMQKGAARAGGAPSQPIPRSYFHGDSREALRALVPPLRGLTRGLTLVTGQRLFVFEKRPPMARGSVLMGT